MPGFQDAVRSAWGSAWDHGDVDALDELIDPNYVLQNADSGAKGSLADLKQEVLEVRAAVPEGLDLGALKDDARLVRLDDVVLVPRFAVADDGLY